MTLDPVPVLDIEMHWSGQGRLEIGLVYPAGQASDETSGNYETDSQYFVSNPSDFMKSESLLPLRRCL